MTRGLGALGLLLVATLALGDGATAAAPTASPGSKPQTILHMLDYVGVDYPGAVKDGKVLDESEFKEQVDFVTQATRCWPSCPKGRSGRRWSSKRGGCCRWCGQGSGGRCDPPGGRDPGSGDQGVPGAGGAGAPARSARGP
jgi:hypothetical protein